MNYEMMWFSTFAMMFFSVVLVIFILFAHKTIGYYKKRDLTYNMRIDGIEKIIKDEFKAVLETLKKL